jgi:hypothetical protein
MRTTESNLSGGIKNDMSKSDNVARALKDFHGVRNFKMMWLMWLLPYALLVGVALALIFTKELYVMYISMIIAVALNLLVFRELIGSIPKALEDLWYQEIIGEKSVVASQKVSSIDVDSHNISQSGVISTEVLVLPKPEAKLEDKYTNFIKDIENSLNNPIMQLVFGLLFSLILISRSFYEFWRWLPKDFSAGLIYRAGGWDALLEGIKLHSSVYLVEYSISEPLKFYTGILLEPFLGFVLGLIVWRMFVIGRYIEKLSQSFDITPKLEHPDKSGGLGSLGRLSLVNALMIGIWGTFLGGWIILGSGTKYSGFYTSFYTVLLVVPVIMSMICFFFPLWNIHIIMAEKMDETRRECCKIGKNIDLLVRLKLDSALMMKDEGPDTNESLERMKNAYECYMNSPVWPFNYRILLAFITSQIVPLLGLTGLATPVVNMAGSLMQFISKITGGGLP